MVWDFRAHRCIRCWVVLVMLLQLLAGTFAHVDLDKCVSNVRLADSDADGNLDMYEFLGLIELFAVACDDHVEIMSEVQRTKFMEYATCPCSHHLVLPSTSCCTPADSSIDVNEAAKNMGDLSFLEQARLSLLCLHTSFLSGELACAASALATKRMARSSRSQTNMTPTESPRRSSSQGPLNNTIDAKSRAMGATARPSPAKIELRSSASGPTNDAMGNETTHIEKPSLPPSVTPSEKPSVSPAAYLPTAPPSAKEVNATISPEPSSTPTKQTLRPSLPLVVMSPTHSPTIVVVNKEISPTPAPPQVVIPSQRPSLALVVNSPTLQPVASAPTPPQSECISAMKEADVDGNRRLGKAEYKIFLQILADCSGLTLNTQMKAAFQTSICLCLNINNLLCCISSREVDISVAYLMVAQRTFQEKAQIQAICETSYYVLPAVGKCTNAPTHSPSPAPTVLVVNKAITPVPSASPLANLSQRPSLALIENPPSRQPIAQAPTPTLLVCVKAIIQADADKNQGLSEAEYIMFLQKISGCSGLSLNSKIESAFKTSMCLCKLNSNAFCCITSQEVDVSSAYLTAAQRSTGEKLIIQGICDTSYKALLGTECVNIPVQVPVQVPARAPVQVPARAPARVPVQAPVGAPLLASVEPPVRAPVKAPVGAPLQAPAQPPVQAPVQASVGAPSQVPAQSPVHAPVFLPTTAQPSIGPTSTVIGNSNVDLTVCTSNMVSADLDSDSLLNRDEYLNFVVAQSGCNLITSLSADLTVAFGVLSCECKSLPNANLNCCSAGNARVAIEGADLAADNRFAAQRNSLSLVCSLTDKSIPAVCTASPVTLSPTSKPPVTPIVPPSSLPFGVPAPRPSASHASAQPLASIRQTNTPSQNVIKSRTGAPASVRTVQTAPPILAAPIPEASRLPANVDTVVPGAPSLPTSVVDSPTGLPGRVAVLPPPMRSTPTPDIPTVSQACSMALVDSDKNQDEYLSQEEFISFIQIFSGCELTTMLSAEQRNVFLALACECLKNPDEGRGCCLPGNSKISIRGEQYVGQDPYYLTKVCSTTEATFGDDCFASPTTSPLVSEDLDQCSTDLIGADRNKDGLLDKVDYLLFIQKYSKCDAITSLDLGHQCTFHALACDCVNSPLATFECCLPGNARLNVSGAGSFKSNRTSKETTTLSRICITADGLLTTRGCVAPPTMTPKPSDCVAALVSADEDFDGMIDIKEYISFLQHEYVECSEMRTLSLSQRVLFNILACSCLLKPDANLECCFPEKAKIDIEAAILQYVNRTVQQSQYLSTICRASNATVELGCRTFSPTVSPSIQFSGEFPGAASSETSIESVTSDSLRGTGRFRLSITNILVALLWSSAVCM